MASSFAARPMDAENRAPAVGGKPVLAPAGGAVGGAAARPAVRTAAGLALREAGPIRAGVPAPAAVAPRPVAAPAPVAAPVAHHAPVAGGAGAGAYFGGYAAAPAPHAMHAHAMDTSDAHISAMAVPAGPGDIPAGVYDVDGADAADPACVPEYAREIYLNQRLSEDMLRAINHYMAHQTDINEKMRAILIDWLEEVHIKFKLMPETMFLTQNLIDRFLEKKIVVRSKLQLVGVTAMLIASKYEEIYAPEVRDFVYITDKAYTREQILQMEATMLNTLDFRVSAPTVYVFLNRYLKCAIPDARLTLLATYIVERQLQEYRMLHHSPSKIAAAAVNMAMRTLRGRGGGALWNDSMVFHSGYTQGDLRPVILELQDIMAAAVTSSLQAVRKKYLLPKFGEVANLPIAPLE